MKIMPLKTAFFVASFAIAAQASAQVIFYESDNFGGRTFTADREVRNFKRFGFNDRASSAVVESGRWEVCERTRFEGNCKVLRPGRYPSLNQIGLGDRISSVQPINRDARIAENRYAPLPRAATPAAAPVTFYEHENFRGASFTAADDVENFSRYGFNNSASSVIITNGPWEVCNSAGFRGRCVALAPGRYPSLASIGLNDRVSSVRRADRNAGRADRDPRRPNVAGVTFYEREGFGGRSFTADQPLGDFNRFGFNDLASSAVVVGQGWEVCQDVGYGGRCASLQAGEYPTLRSMNLDNRISSVRRVDLTQQPPPVAAAPTPSVIFFEGENFNGLSFNTRQAVGDFNRNYMQGRIQSAEVAGGTWEVCPSPQYGGQCMLLRPGRYPTPASMGMRGNVGSARISDDHHSGRDVPRRGDERLYEAQVTSVRAVVGTPEQRCWVDREQVERTTNVPAAIAGALLGGLLGNQVGGGTGKDVATIGGVVAGAAIGARVGRGDDSREVRRCEEIPSQARTEYWDVTYNFRGTERRVQLNTAPGRTVTVNEQGEVRS